MSHDRYCPLGSLPEDGCVICADLTAARAEEKRAFTESWKSNLPLIERRNYLAGYADGVAGHPPRYP